MNDIPDPASLAPTPLIDTDHPAVIAFARRRDATNERQRATGIPARVGYADVRNHLSAERMRNLLKTDVFLQHRYTELWLDYIQLTEVEQAFKEINHDLAIRPIFQKTEERIEAHIFVALLAYCLQVTLKAKLRTLAGGTTPREVIAKFKTMQMVDVHLPTTDGRELTMSRYTQPEVEHHMLLDQLRLNLPSQPPPKITAAQARQTATELAMQCRPTGLAEVKSTS